MRRSSGLSITNGNAAGILWRKIHMMTSPNGIILRITGPFEGLPPVNGGYHSQSPVTRSFAVFFDLRREQTGEQTIETLVIWDAMCSLWRRCNDDKK